MTLAPSASPKTGAGSDQGPQEDGAADHADDDHPVVEGQAQEGVLGLLDQLGHCLVEG